MLSDFRAVSASPDTQEGISRGSQVNALLTESPLKEDFRFLRFRKWGSVKIVWKSPLQDVCIPGVLKMLPVYFLGQSLVPGDKRGSSGNLELVGKGGLGRNWDHLSLSPTNKGS